MLYLRFQRYSIIAREDRTRQGMVSIGGDRAKHALRAIRTLTVMVLSHVPLPVGVRRQTQCLLGARPGRSALPESAGRASGTWETQSGQQESSLRRKFPKLLLYHFTTPRNTRVWARQDSNLHAHGGGFTGPCSLRQAARPKGSVSGRYSRFPLLSLLKFGADGGN